jgi:DNA-directed RNA polymerase specialized sigma24 family protein
VWDARPHPGGVPHCPGFVTALVLRCAQGDRSALGTLFDLLHGPVAATLGAPGVSRDDLVVEVFRDVWLQAPTFPRGADPVAWVLDLARAAAGRTRTAVAV